MREEMIAIGSIKRIRNPIMPNREPPLVIRTKIESRDIIMRTGRTPIIPFFTTLSPALVLENSPSVSEPNSAGII